MVNIVFMLNFNVYVTHLCKTSCKSQNSVSRYWAKTIWEAFLN